MSRAFFAATRNAISILSSTCSSLRSRALQPPQTIRGFHALRPIIRLPPDHIYVDRSDGQGVIPCPPYPYSPRHTFKEADAGLYGGAQLQSGNKISQGRNKGKTRRKWYPNVRLETIRSEALDKEMTIPITASCMRTIRKCGGLDQYLLGDKPARIKELGVFGWRLRWMVMNSPMMSQRHEAERKNLGLSPDQSQMETFDEAWEKDERLREEVLREQEKQWEETRKKDERFRQHVTSKWQPKDNKKYSAKQMVPPFDKETFRLLEPELPLPQDSVQV